MAEERLSCSRCSSIAATSSDSVSFFSPATNFRPAQKLSSKEMLVLCPAMPTERFTTRDLILPPLISDKRESCALTHIVRGDTARSVDWIGLLQKVQCYTFGIQPVLN